jgi:hypothetical protein
MRAQLVSASQRFRESDAKILRYAVPRNGADMQIAVQPSASLAVSFNNDADVGLFGCFHYGSFGSLVAVN